MIIVLLVNQCFYFWVVRVLVIRYNPIMLINYQKLINLTLGRTRRYLIGDSIEGWADAVKVLMECYFKGLSRIRFDYSDIRPKGAMLVTSGGKAPGPQPLRECLVKDRRYFITKRR